MSGSKFNPTKFIDRLMSDGKRRSERQIIKALMGAYQEQAERDLQTWLTLRNTPEDQGLRLDERGPWNGKKDIWGNYTRYPYWRVEQNPEKIAPGNPLDRLPMPEQALTATQEEARTQEAVEKAQWARKAGLSDE